MGSELCEGNGHGGWAGVAGLRAAASGSSGTRPPPRPGEQGLSLRALARRLQRSHSTLVEYEWGHRLPPLDVVEAYETELGVASGTLAAVHERARIQVYGEDRSHRRTYVLKPG